MFNGTECNNQVPVQVLIHNQFHFIFEGVSTVFALALHCAFTDVLKMGCRGIVIERQAGVSAMSAFLE